jgi:hypothetical protein
MEYFKNTKPTLTKGSSMSNLKAKYDLQAGQTFTATRGMSLFLLMEATSTNRGEFVFTIWLQEVAGLAVAQPATWTPDPKIEEEKIPEPEPEPVV